MALIRVLGALLFTLALALLLLWPVLRADSKYTLTVRDSSAPITAPHVISVQDLQMEREVEVASGAVDEKRWRLVFATETNWWCYTFQVVPGPTRQGVACSEAPAPASGASVMFSPAEGVRGINHAVLVAALPSQVEELTLRATDDARIRGVLVRPPVAFATRPVLLVAFLPPSTDIVEAHAWSETSEAIKVGALVDIVDAY